MTTLSRLFRRNPMPGLATRFALAMLLAVPWQAALSASDEVSQEVYAAERAFARSMADRDMAAFARHVSEEAVFFNGTGVLRGKPEVMATWSRFFQGKTAPFSWDPIAWKSCNQARWHSAPDWCVTQTARSSAASIRYGAGKQRACGASCLTRAARRKSSLPGKDRRQPASRTRRRRRQPVIYPGLWSVSRMKAAVLSCSFFRSGTCT